MTRTIVVILLIAVVAILLVAGCKNKQQAVGSTPKTDMATTPVVGLDEASCPVLGTIMKKSEMIPFTYKGKTYYMCCPPCIQKFKANPDQYIQHPATPHRSM